MISDLSSDLLEEILCRVPAIPLGRSKFTCKRWNALLKNPRFLKKQFDKAAKESLLVTRKLGTVSSMSFYLHGNHNNIVTRKLSLLVGSHTNSQAYISEVIPCDGLFLCTTNIQEKLVVLNPCTGQTMWLKPGTPLEGSDIYALGYTNNKWCNNYKILRLGFTGRKEIYVFSSKSWRVSNDDFYSKYLLRSHGVSVKGNTYWLATFKDGVQSKSFLLKFDFTTERFHCISFPGGNHSDYFMELEVRTEGNHSHYHMSLAVVKEEQLLVLNWSSREQEMVIWMSTKIETTNVSWRIFSKVDLRNIPHMDDYGISFFTNYDMKVLVCRYRSLKFVYVIGDEEGKFREISLGEEEENILRTSISFNYVPSLVRF